MGPITYSLCHQPIIGPIMWILTLCAIQSPISPVYSSLDNPGVIIHKQFEVKVDKPYPMSLDFNFKSNEERLSRWKGIFGSGLNKNCTCAKETLSDTRYRSCCGIIIPIRIILKKMPDSTLIFDRTYNTYGKNGWNSTRVSRVIGYLNLTIGTYDIEVYNIESQSDLKDINMAFGIGG